MPRPIARRLSFANVVSLLALFVALSGSSYAAMKVGSDEITDNSVRGRDIHENTVRGTDVRDGDLKGRDVRDNTLTGEDLKESTLEAVPRAEDALTLQGKPASAFLGSDRQTRTGLIKLAFGETKTIASSGPFTWKAACSDDGGGSTRLTVTVESTEAGATVGAFDPSASGNRLARVAGHRLRQCGPRPDLHDRLPPQRRRPERGGSHRARVRRAAGRWRRLRRQRGAVAVMSTLRSHLSYANVMATVAVFLALGGASYAAVSLPRDSVGTAQLRERSVTRSKLAARSVDTKRLRDDAVDASKLAAGAVKKHSLSPWIRDQLGRRAEQGPPGPRGDDGPARPGRRAGSLFAGRERHAESRGGARRQRPVVQRELRGQRGHDHPELRRALERGRHAAGDGDRGQRPRPRQSRQRLHGQPADRPAGRGRHFRPVAHPRRPATRGWRWRPSTRRPVPPSTFTCTPS